MLSEKEGVAMARPEWRDLEKEKYWRRMLRRWRQSGRTGRDFCAEQALSEPSFYAWRREIARRDQERSVARPGARRKRSASARQPSAGPFSLGDANAVPTFVKVALPGDGATSAIEVVVAVGRVIRVRPGFDAATLRQLLRVLEEPSC
jgi:hypothetical protein